MRRAGAAMMHRRRMFLAFGILQVFALAGCATDGMPPSSMIGIEPYPPPGLPHRVASSHVELYWKCDRVEPNMMRLDGMARNPWSSQEVRFLEFDLVGVDQDGRKVSDVHATAPNYLLGTNQTTRFQLTLRRTGREARYDLHYQYLFQDFEIDARVAGPPMRPQVAQSAFLFMIRDACSDTQHRAQ